MQQDLVFKEKQFLGRNLHMLFIRIILAVFCFTAYFWSKNREQSGNLFLVVGVVIIVLSIILTFLTHFKTRVYTGSIELEQFWMFRKIKIPIKNLASIEIIPYDRFYINNPVFNLHLRGRVHFYTNGELAVKLTDKDGLVYIIGSKESEQLKNSIQKQMDGT